MALDNNGSGVILYSAQTVWAFNADFTYTCWFTPINISQVGTIFELDDSVNSKQMTFRIYNDTVMLSGWAGTSYIQRAGFVANTRYFITVTGVGTALRMTVNANFAGATTATATRPVGNWAVAEYPSMFGSIWNEYLYGRVRDFRYYNRKLSDNEIATLYYSTSKDDIVQGLQIRFLFNSKHIGATLGAFTEVKNLANKSVVMSGYGTSTDLSYSSSFPERKASN